MKLSNHKMIILGIDPGLAQTGYGIIETEAKKIIPITYGSIATKANSPFPKRLEKIHLELKKIIKKYQPDKIALEELFFAKNVKTALKVSEARGVIQLTAIQQKISILEFTPLQVKQALVGYGRADKIQIQKMVQLNLNLKTLPKPDHAADALAIAICCAQTNKTIA